MLACQGDINIQMMEMLACRGDVSMSRRYKHTDDGDVSIISGCWHTERYKNAYGILALAEGVLACGAKDVSGGAVAAPPVITSGAFTHTHRQTFSACQVNLLSLSLTLS